LQPADRKATAAELHAAIMGDRFNDSPAWLTGMCLHLDFGFRLKIIPLA